ncbi:hypothetical protein DYBT9275_04317 [Dyadobacter sp. CECT 9275]|uniref:Glycoside hydrolase n=2 Tax=Dyadobacter helix TaxID=2822344 RepID=A0A916JFK4_9BACT|nr:hypothetical protein DYBT9275_04317 [Dyadobacter sp. CECT 9275]
MRKLVLLIIFTCSSVYAQTVSTAKPWTYWWWMGSAVSERDITLQLQGFQKAGLGGVHIIPIYGVKGYEKEFLPFLSVEWLKMMGHTVREGKRLGIGVDMTTGTGWPFGGPNVTADMAAKTMSVKNGDIAVQPTGQKVKRAAPGGEGLVFDPFHKRAMAQYLIRFDSSFLQIKDRPRAMYMDSYEAYGANWTADFQEEFKKRRGYDFIARLNLFTDTTDRKESQLVKIDYHETLAELLRERYAHVWTDWSRQHGFKTRYQAHGSPGNLLDLYDEADIPETESFGSSRFPIPGLSIDPDYSVKQFGTPNPLGMKFASSAAHFSGKYLVSSETGTWLGNHFKVSLSQVKPQIDELFTAGINHIFYHGTTYSPASEVYPGWLFYASTHFGATSHFAEYFPLLNRYVENCQNILQNTRPDNDVLVYFPIHDLWATRTQFAGGIHSLGVHHVDEWLLGLPFGKLSEKLWRSGFSFDYVSESQLKRLSVDKSGNLDSGGSIYKTIIIPESVFMSEQTLKELTRLAKRGARVIFEERSPATVTGYVNHRAREEKFKAGINELKRIETVSVSADWKASLIANGAVEEELSERGLTFIRKRLDHKVMYFIANVGNTFTEGWLTISKGQNFEHYDPLTGKESALTHRKHRGKTEVYLSLLPGQSCFLKQVSENRADDSAVVSLKNAMELSGIWAVRFLNGRPALPADASTGTLKSWTEFSDAALYFSGKGLYTLKFNLSHEFVGKQGLSLDLGEVREIASVKINGVPLGVAWSIPFRLAIAPEVLKAGDNLLEIEVSNLSANYMRLRDTQAPEWKKFYDINMADITYGKFSAAKWEPMPSGLLGPVRLLYP